MLLRSDGCAVACGDHSFFKCSIPSLKSWHELFTFAKASCRYISTCQPRATAVNRILQLGVAVQDDTAMLTCWDLAGHEVIRSKVSGSDLALEIHKRMARELKVSLQRLRVVLPDGQLLASICRANPLVTIAEISEASPE